MRRLWIGLFAAALVTTGCAQPMTKTQKGAAIGTGVGAAVGAGLGQAIGKNSKSTLLGAGAGALAGGLAGGLFGNYMEKQEAAMRQQLAGVEGASIQRDVDLLTVTFKSDLLFDVNSASLRPGAFDEIQRVATVLNQYPQTNIVIAGHTDSTGSETYNQKLSERRALSVKNALIGQGVNPTRMSTVGHGEMQPVAGNGSEAGRQLNRRVEVRISPQQG